MLPISSCQPNKASSQVFRPVANVISKRKRSPNDLCSRPSIRHLCTISSSYAFCHHDLEVISSLGFKLSIMSVLLPTTSFGTLLSLYAPARILASCAALTLVPWLRPDRTLPASLVVPAEDCAPKREGGAKSRPVKEADLRSACLRKG
jgi:hypothetical protein